MLEDPGERSRSGRTSAGWSARIKSGPVLAGLGIGLEVLTVTALFTLFEKRGWLYRYRSAFVSSASRVVGG
jgi:hypothetical protein